MGRWVWQPLSAPGSNVCDSARAGGGEGAAWRAVRELKWANKENSQQPPASSSQLHQETSVTPGKAVRIRLPEKIAQVNNWWRLIRPGQSLQKTSASDFERFWNPLPSTGYGSEARTWSAATDLPSRVWLRPFCLLATSPVTRSYPHPGPSPPSSLPYESSLSLVTSTLSSLAVPPSPLPSPVRSAHEYQCTSWGASGTAWYLACSPAWRRSSAESRTPGSNRLWGPPSLHVNAIVWRNRVGVELRREGPKSCSAKKWHIILRS